MNVIGKIITVFVVLFCSMAEARYYDPVTGRYTQPDPIGLQGGNNPYVYVDANPVNEIDPDGLIGRNPNGYYKLYNCGRPEMGQCVNQCQARGGVKSCKITKGARSIIVNGTPVKELYTVPGSMSCECNEDDKPKQCPPEKAANPDPVPQEPIVPVIPVDPMPTVPGVPIRPMIPIRVPIFIP